MKGFRVELKYPTYPFSFLGSLGIPTLGLFSNWSKNSKIKLFSSYIPLILGAEQFDAMGQLVF